MHHHKSELWKQRKILLFTKLQHLKQIGYLDLKSATNYPSFNTELFDYYKIKATDLHMRKLDTESSKTHEELLEKATQFWDMEEWKEGAKVYHELYSIYLNSVTPVSLEHLVDILLQKTKPKKINTIHQNEHFLSCRMCLGLLYNPVSLECGHSFCKKCAIANTTKSCKICGSVYNLNTLNSNVSLDAIIQHVRPKQYESSRLRSEGNNLFSVMDFSGCLQKYSESIELDGESHLSLSNRSHVNSLLGKFKESLEDADKIIHLKPQWVKGHYRQGIALLGLGRNQEAAMSFFKCAQLDPANTSVKHCLCKALHDMLLSYTLQKCKNIPRQSLASKETEEEDRLKSVSSDADALLCFIEECLELPNPSCGTKEDENTDSGEETFPPAPPETVCLLCTRFIYDPVTTPCGHISCLTCINRSLDHRPYCPVCRSDLHEHVTLRKKNVTEVLNKIIQTCWPEDYSARKQQHEEEIAALASVAEDTAEEIPVFVCTPALPSVICLLHVFEPRYRLMMRQCMESGSRQFGMCAYDPRSRLANFGTMLVIRELQYLADGRSLVDSIGARRFKVLDRGMRDGYNTAKVEWIKDVTVPDHEKENIRLLLQFVYAQATNWIGSLPRGLQNRVEREHGCIPANEEESINTPNGPAWMWWLINILPMEVQKQVEFIGMTSLQTRLLELQRILFHLTHM